MNSVRCPWASQRRTWEPKVTFFGVFQLKSWRNFYSSLEESMLQFLYVKTFSGKAVWHSLAYLTVYKWLVGTSDWPAKCCLYYLSESPPPMYTLYHLTHNRDGGLFCGYLSFFSCKTQIHLAQSQAHQFAGAIYPGFQQVIEYRKYGRQTTTRWADAMKAETGKCCCSRCKQHCRRNLHFQPGKQHRRVH